MRKIIATLSLILSSSVFAVDSADSIYGDTIYIVNRSNYAFTVQNELDGSTTYLPANGTITTPLLNENDKTFTTSIYITGMNTQMAPHYTFAFFTGYSIDKRGVFIPFIPANYPAGYSSWQNYCDSTRKNVCTLSYGVGGYIGNQWKNFVATITQ